MTDFIDVLEQRSSPPTADAPGALRSRFLAHDDRLCRRGRRGGRGRGRRPGALLAGPQPAREPADSAPADDPGDPPPPVSLAVLNGTKITGLARGAADELKGLASEPTSSPTTPPTNRGPGPRSTTRAATARTRWVSRAACTSAPTASWPMDTGERALPTAPTSRSSSAPTAPVAQSFSHQHDALRHRLHSALVDRQPTRRLGERRVPELRAAPRARSRPRRARAAPVDVDRDRVAVSTSASGPPAAASGDTSATVSPLLHSPEAGRRRRTRLRSAGRRSRARIPPSTRARPCRAALRAHAAHDEHVTRLHGAVANGADGLEAVVENDRGTHELVLAARIAQAELHDRAIRRERAAEHDDRRLVGERPRAERITFSSLTTTPARFSADSRR